MSPYIFRTLDSYAPDVNVVSLGTITAARIPKITITAINSINVKPDCDVLFFILKPLIIGS